MSDFTDERDAFLNHIKSWFATLKSRIVSLLSSGVMSLEKAVIDNEAKIEGDTLDFFKTAAMNAVTAAAAAGGDNSTKAIAALASFTTELATKGVTLAENDSKLLLESAYADFKASQAVAVPAA